MDTVPDEPATEKDDITSENRTTDGTTTAHGTAAGNRIETNNTLTPAKSDCRTNSNPACIGWDLLLGDVPFITQG